MLAHSALPRSAGRRNARSTAASASAEGRKNICLTSGSTNAAYPPACAAALPTRLPSISTTPAMRSGSRRAASSTTRQPMLWPIRIALRSSRFASSAATSPPSCSIEHSCARPGVAPWPRRSQATTSFVFEK